MRIRIISLNFYDKSEKPLNAAASVIEQDADIICIQEAPEIVWRNLENNRAGYRVFHARDQENKGRVSRLYILVKTRQDLHVEESGHTIARHSQKPSSYLLFRIRASCGRMFGYRQKKLNMCLESQSVLLRSGSSRFRIVNCHLDAHSSIVWRLALLRRVVRAHFRGEPVVLCGDLNTHGVWWRSIMAGWLFGVRRNELCINEVKRLDRFAEAHELVRVFKKFYDWRTFPWIFGHITHPLTMSNIDHILVSENAFRVIDRRLLRGRHKSDHRGLLADLEIV